MNPINAANAIHAIDAEQANNAAPTVYQALDYRMKSIKSLPIDRLDERQPGLVGILADLVNYETNCGCDVDDTEFVNSQDWWGSLVAMARELGYTFLGNGFFSAVFSHVSLPGRVIKVGFKKEDSGAAYAAFCRANPGLQGLPVIHAIARHDACYTVVLDHLKPYSAKSPEVLDQYNIVKTQILNRDSDAWDFCEAYDEVTQGLQGTAAHIREFFYGVAGFDIHEGNVMLDHNDNIVITDPVSYTNGLGEPDDFRVDFEALLEEIQAMKLEEAIEKWQQRHLRKLSKAQNRKAHRAHKRRIAKIQAEREAMRKLASAVRHDDDRAFELVVGVKPEARYLNNRWVQPEGLRVHWKNSIRVIHEKNVERHNRMVMDINMGRPLDIDKRLDAMFMG